MTVPVIPRDARASVDGHRGRVGAAILGRLVDADAYVWIAAKARAVWLSVADPAG